jgi:hypothetical protein
MSADLGQSSRRAAGKGRTLRTSAETAEATGTLARAMAKKVRTPPPPRRVQAPQKRETRRAAGVPTRPPWVYALYGGAAVAVVAAIVLGVILLKNNGSSASSVAPTSTYNSLPGIRKTKAPWPPEYQFLADRLLPLGLSQLAAEALAFHIHQHLDIFVNGKHVTVPRFVGINPGAGYLTELHTHDSSGIVHVESATHKNYTLGQFFAEWAVRLTGRCVGAYCNGLTWYVNGQQQTGNPQNLVLRNHQEIAIVVGKPPATIPSTFNWAAHGV